ncbi:uncharacterized protein FIBRA_02880 [Fibroporia radiculosa]|uniref:tripeptidyl-peptidase II n=1 Tax=Fibroporia radiculosa TaxID=599839 RepID=J4G364_9APHY|nr:uncharacterized protein FIBRA_02880 [Fibroporia radiculosa]CCM00838.1 predicted protein [Fibroporia radiculosa]
MVAYNSILLISQMTPSVFTALALLAPLLTSGSTVRSAAHVHRRANGPPADFTLVGVAPTNTVLSFRLALTQSNPAGLEEALYNVSMPSSLAYKKYLDKAEAARFVSPSADTLSAVNSWLQAQNIHAATLTPAGDWLGINVSVSRANDLFDAEFGVYNHTRTGLQTIRTLSYTIPEELVGHMTLVYPTTTFPEFNSMISLSLRPAIPRRAEASKTLVAASCAEAIIPSCLQSLYSIPTTPATQSSNQFGVTGFFDEYANQADLQTFLGTYRPDMSNSTTFSFESVDGGINPQNASDAGGEANIDTQYTVGLATDVPTIFISVGQSSGGAWGGFLDVINYLLSQDSPPQVLTTSYAGNEDELPFSFADNLCNAYAQLGARGVSILFASGDGGVSGWQAGTCDTFVPVFPATCPFVTAVGATEGINPETGGYFSSGGFSNFWATPSYQKSAVSTYLSHLGDTYSGLYNASGRGFPDVSAQGLNFEIVYEQDFYSAAGTSCSTPTFASVIALLNDELVAAGEPSLGFLNPWLYSSAASAFNDITTGSNPGCNTTGFNATAGWDPITGLGTPDYIKLRAAAGL